MTKKKQLTTSGYVPAFIQDHWPWILFAAILLFGMWLRFYKIETFEGFGWDQARDAWTVRDIILGKPTLIGPRTGIGHFHLGPAYYYLLVPFFALFHLDPIASEYFNMLANIVNFVAIFWVGKKLFRVESALFITLIYAVSAYLVQMNRIPWNVTMVPGFSVLIFYGLIQIAQGKYRWMVFVNVLAGFFFNLHLTALFFPPIILLSLIVSPQKKKALLWYLASLPFFLIWFLPNVFSESVSKTGDYFKLRDFYHDYVMGFHLQFLLHRIPDALIQFSALIRVKSLDFLRYLLPVVFIIMLLFFEKETMRKKEGFILLLFFLVPLIGFTIYSGPISDYYFLLSMPMVLFVMAYLQEKVVSFNPKIVLPLLGIVWLTYAFTNTKEMWYRSQDKGLANQKKEVTQRIKEQNPIPYNEGDIRAYLYEVGSQK